MKRRQSANPNRGKSQKLRTVLIGAGRVAAAYSLNPRYTRWYRYATHADVLAAHPDFDWVATVDPDAAARALVAAQWPGRAVVASLRELPADLAPLEVAVIATPPAGRLSLLRQLPASVSALLVEKPLGLTVRSCQKFLADCQRRKLPVQVNLWRRGDALHRRLAGGGLTQRIGTLRGVNVVFDGNLLNTATHVIDVIEMLAGPVQCVHATRGNSCLLELQSGAAVTLLAVPATTYRELSLDFWGTRGRLRISQEDLRIVAWQARPHRALAGTREIAADTAGKELQATVGEAFYHLYTNLADVCGGRGELWAPGVLALRAATVIAAIGEAQRRGRRVAV